MVVMELDFLEGLGVWTCMHIAMVVNLYTGMREEDRLRGSGSN